jgi:hypothetical protein
MRSVNRTALTGLGLFLPAVALLGVALGATLRPPIAAVVVAGLGLAATAAPLFHRARSARFSSDSACDLERHLAWFRRREESGDVVVVRVPACTDAGRVHTAFRITDSVMTASRGGQLEVGAVLDRTGLDREGLERRLSGVLGQQLDFGWARFPEDGITLAGLLERAREELPDAAKERPSALARHRAAAPRIAVELSLKTGGIR